MQEQQMDWRSFFEVILANTNTDYEIVSADSTVAVRANAADIATISERLQAVFTNINRFLPLQFQQAAGNVQQQAIELARPQNTIADGRAIFKRIFGRLAENFGFMPDIVFGDGSTVSNFKLWSQEAKQGVASFWVQGIDLLVSACHQVTADELKQAWSGGDSPLEMPQHSPADFALARGLLQQCIGHRTDVDANGGRHTRFYFDFGTLWQLLSKPSLEHKPLVTPTQDNYSHELVFDEAHLTHYMQTLLQDGVMFRVYRTPEEANQYRSIPIFLTNPELRDLQNMIVLVLDNSGSMYDHFSSLVAQVKLYIDNIRLEDSNIRLRIVTFPINFNLQRVVTEFSIANNVGINNYLDKLSADPFTGTPLYTTVDEELAYLTTLDTHHNIRMVVFTDGVDSSGQPWQKYAAKIATNIKALNRVGTLQLLPIGAGKPDQNSLTSMATTCGTEYIFFNSPADLKGRFQEVASKQPMRRFVDFFVQLHDQTRKFSLRVPQTGGPFIPRSTEMSFAMAPGQQMVVQKDGEQFEFTLLDPHEIPDASLTDRLRELEARALNTALDESVALQTRLQKIQDLVTQISSQPSARLYEILAIENCKKRVNDVLSALQNGLHNSNQAASANTRFQQQSGLANVEPAEMPKAKKSKDTVDYVYANGPNLGSSFLPKGHIVYDTDKGIFAARKTLGFQMFHLPIVAIRYLSNAFMQSSTLTDFKPNDSGNQHGFIFDQGNWNTKIATHAVTGEQIHQFDGYRDGAYVGSVYFYQSRMLCRDAHGQRHNVIAMTGEFAQRQHYLNTHVQEIQDVCASLPPNTFEASFIVSGKAASFGLVRGSAKVLAATVIAFHPSDRMKFYTPPVLVNTAVFSYRLYVYSSQYSTWTEAATQAAIDTGVMFGLAQVLNQGCEVVKAVGRFTLYSGYQQAGKSLYLLGSIGSIVAYYAYDTLRLGIIPATCSTIAGIATEVVTEKAGSSLVGNMGSFFARSYRAISNAVSSESCVNSSNTTIGNN